MSATEERAESRPADHRTKPCVVTIKSGGRTTTRSHSKQLNPKMLAQAITRNKIRRGSETREERLLQRRERLVDAELKLSKLFGKRK